MADQVIATAFIKIRPDLTGFKKDLEAEVKARTANLKPVRIRIEPDIRGFKGDLDKKLGALKQSTIKVNAVIGTVIQEGKVPTVRVRGVVEGTTAAGAARTRAAAGEGGVAKKAKETAASASATGKMTEKEKAAAKAFAATQREVDKLNNSLATLKAVQKEVTEGIRDRTHATELLGRVTPQITRLQDQATRTRGTVVPPEAQKAEKIARDLQSRIKTEIAGFDAVTEAERKAAKEQEKIQKEATRTAQAEAKRRADQATSEANRKKKRLESVERSIIRAEEIGQVSRAAGTGATTEVERLSQIAGSQGRAVIAAERAAKKAREDGTVALQKRANQLVKTTKEELANTKALLEEEKAQRGLNRTFAQARRGTLATGASFLGLRGAVLSATGPFLAATVAFTALAKSIGLAVNLEQQLNVFQATARATANEMEQVSARARELGADIRLPAVTAGDAASAMVELAKAGLSVQDSMDGARGVLELATAAAIDNATAVELAASALNAFGLAGEQAGHVADVLANAANESQGSIADMGVALQQSSAVARQVGIDLEDTAALLTLLARNGLKGSDAGTSLRTSLLKLVAPTRQVQQVLDTLGIQLRDLEGNVRPDVFAQFGKATANLSAELRDQIAGEIFGQDAIRAVSIFSREGVEGLDAMRKALEREGAASELAAARTKGLGGSVSALASNFQTLAETMVSPALPALEGLTDGLNEIVSGVNNANNAINTFFDDLQQFADPNFDPTLLFPAQAARIRKHGETFKFFGEVLRDFKSAAEGVDALLEKTGDASTFAADAEKQIAAGKGIEALQTLRLRLDEAGVSTAGVDDQLKSLQTTLDNLAVGDPDQLVQLNSLEVTLLSLRQLQAQFREAGVDAGGLTTQILEVNHQLQLMQGAVGRLATEGVPDFVVTPLRKAQAEINNIVAEIRANASQLGSSDANIAEAAASSIEGAINRLKRSAGGRDALQTVGEDVGKQFGDALRSSIEDAVPGIELSAKKIPDGIRQQVKLLSQLGPAGEAQLRAIGRDLSQALADGMKEENKAVKEAQRQLNEIIESGKEAVQDSIRSARSGLRSLSEGLSGQVGELIDAGPMLRDLRSEGKGIVQVVGTSVKKLEDQLERLRSQRQRASADRALRDARKELRDARESIIPGGDRQEINEFLDPFQQKLKDAASAVKELTLEEQIEQQDKLREAAKRAAEQGIAKLVKQFERGAISAEEFSKQLRSKLAPEMDTLAKQGKNMGLFFTEEFRSQLDAVVQQAKELAGFLGVEGTEPGPNVEKPGKAVQEQAKREKEARQRVTEALRAQANTAKNTKDARDFLEEIRDFLKPKPKTGAKGATGDTPAGKRGGTATQETAHVGEKFG